MAEEAVPSYALFGSGEVDPDNAAALLDDLLPAEDIGVFYRPVQVPRGTPLKAVVDRLETPKLLGPKGTLPADDLIEALVSRRKGGDDVLLIALWPEEPTDEEKEMVTQARALGIRVVSIGDAIDDLLWEPEPEVPDVEEPAEEAPAEKALAPAVIPVGTPSQVVNVLEAWVRAIVQDQIERMVLPASLVAAPATGSAPVASKAAVAPKEAVEKVAAHLAGKSSGKAGPKEIEDNPPFDGPYNNSGPQFKAAPGGSADDEVRTAYYWAEAEDTYRKAKTRPRRGEKRVMLTDAEIDQHVRDGKVTDN